MNFIFSRISILTLIGGILLLNISCNKTDSLSNTDTRGGIALTFDDYGVDNWHTYIKLFDSLGIKATFYVSNYNKFTAAQKAKLQDLQAHGHEIAFHSTNHVDFVKCVDSTNITKLLNTEVVHGLRLMNNDGFYPTTFAYPYGKHNDNLDRILLKRFKSVRALNGTQDLSRSLAQLHDNKIIFGLGIDEGSNRSLDKIKGLLYLGQQKNRCAVLLIHHIERSDINLQLPLWKLKEIVASAKSLNLKFYTISEISK